MLYSDMSSENHLLSYKKLLGNLKTNFGYSLQSNLVGMESVDQVKEFKSDIETQQDLIAESVYEYTSKKYNRNILLLEALNHLITLLEIRTYRIEPKTGALVNHMTVDDKVKTLLNPKDVRPDLNYFTADHLHIEEPIKVTGKDDMNAAPYAQNAANQVAPEENMKKAEVYVSPIVSDMSIPVISMDNKLDHQMNSVETSNIVDKVVQKVKGDLAKQITDMALASHRKQREDKLDETIAYDVYLDGREIDTVFWQDNSDPDEVKHSLINHDGYDPNIEVIEHGMRESKETSSKTSEAINTTKIGEGKMASNQIIKKLLESEIEKAEIVLGVKAITDTLQDMAEKIAKMQVEDLSALTERLKAEFGVEKGDQFQAQLSGFLSSSLQALQASKSSIDNEALILSGDHAASNMAAAPAQGTQGTIPAPTDDEELPGGSDEEDMFGGHEAGAGPEEEPLGRAKKEESLSVSGEALTEAKNREAFALAQKIFSQLSEAYKKEKDPKKKEEIKKKAKKLKESAVLFEKWSKKAKINPKKKGMFDGKSLEELRSARAKLKKKENHSEADTTKLRELNYAIRAKTGWGKVKESVQAPEKKKIK